MDRRDFLVRTGLALGGALAAARGLGPRVAKAGPATPTDWTWLRSQFNLSRDVLHFAGFFLASHPKPVRDAIDAHRRGLDENPIRYWWDHQQKSEAEVLASAAGYLGVQPTDIALTDSTTMGLGLLYGGLKLKAGQDVLTTTHDHYATQTALELRAQRTGAQVRTVPLYREGAAATEEEIVGSIVRALKPHTRVVAVTWVHSSTGVRLPLRAIADALAPINAKRAEGDRVLLCADGVHGMAAAETTLPELGCDFFIAGCHKWLYGPRGTGLVWGKPGAWPAATATIPTFDEDAYEMWMKLKPQKPLPPRATMTPGGFHSFEHRWALAEAFRLHAKLGKQAVAARITALNRQLKEGLRAMKHVTLHTPMDDKLSAGIVAFEVKGMTPVDVESRLREHKVIASVSPYAVMYARLSASAWNTLEEVDTALRHVRSFGGAS